MLLAEQLSRTKNKSEVTMSVISARFGQISVYKKGKGKGAYSC